MHSVPGGTLLVAEYDSSGDLHALTSDTVLQQMGFAVAGYRSGFLNGQEMTRVAMVVREE